MQINLRTLSLRDSLSLFCFLCCLLSFLGSFVSLPCFFFSLLCSFFSILTFVLRSEISCRPSLVTVSGLPAQLMRERL